VFLQLLINNTAQSYISLVLYIFLTYDARKLKYKKAGLAFAIKSFETHVVYYFYQRIQTSMLNALLLFYSLFLLLSFLLSPHFTFKFHQPFPQF